MLTQFTEHIHPAGRTNALRTVIVVGQPGQTLPDTAFDAADYDVVFIEPLARAYSTIKRVQPSLVVMGLSFDDPDSFQLMSMLKLDQETASIPLRAFAATGAEEPGEDGDALEHDSVKAFSAMNLSMN
ncbi:MAG TPA: hypothetical protein VGF24_16375 [Vicinamibacterales bacterium]|jgi:CheY-like chemotaxis protein